MKPGLAALERRHAELLARCAAERETAAAASQDLLVVADRCDARLAKLRNWLSNPVVLGAGIGVAWLLRRGALPQRLVGTLGVLGSLLRLRALL